MTDSSKEKTPKKSNRKGLIVATLILAAIASDYLHFHFLFGKEPEQATEGVVIQAESSPSVTATDTAK